jgi:hypothetical protein
MEEKSAAFKGISYASLLDKTALIGAYGAFSAMRGGCRAARSI